MRVFPKWKVKMERLWLFLFIPGLILLCDCLDKGDLPNSYGVAGGSVDLPCNTSAANKENYPMLVMWFKDNNLNPFYSYDARKLSSAGGSHWSDSSLSGRVSFILDGLIRGTRVKEPGKIRNSSVSTLTIHTLREEDGGIYRCRVDFKQAPTINSEVNLAIFVPPEKPVLVDEDGNQVKTFFGPYFEGEKASISCEVSGGRPKPYISWLKNGEPIKAATEVSSGQVVTSRLRLDGLRRNENNHTLTCLTNNNDISQPIRTSVHILMNLAPLSVTISNKLRKLLAGKDYSFTCLSQGYSPKVEFLWFLGDTNMPHPSLQQKGEVSLFQFRPTIEDHGRTLRCQAFNPIMPLQSIQDSLVLDIYYKPVISLHHGHGIVGENIREGSDVYLECRVKSRPKTENIIWIKDNSEVKQDLSQGRLVSGQSLVLQNISRSDSGNYSCRAQNSEGRSSSNKIQVKVKYKPICKSRDLETIAVGHGEQVFVPCRVSANPPEVEFHWYFNSSDNKEYIDLPISQYSTTKTTSILQFSLHSERDYGIVQCLARNEIGQQSEPCYVHLVPKDTPDTPEHCSVTDSTTTSVTLICTHSNLNGDIFTLELYQDTQLTQLVQNLSNSKPRWNMDRLSPGKQYMARIYATNLNGQSQPFLLRVPTQQESSRFLILPPEENMSEYDETLDDDNADDEDVSLPFTLKVILFSLLMVAFILIVFSASVGAICRIQCKIVEENARLHVETQSTATSPIGSGSSFGPDIINHIHQTPLISPTEEYFPNQTHLFPIDRNKLSLSPRKTSQPGTTITNSSDSLVFSDCRSFTTDNVSFSSFEILPTHDVGPSLQFSSPYPSTLPRPNSSHGSILNRGWVEGQGSVEPKKIEKQRSVTFGSIDLLEPIEEDYSLESRV
eukprot:TRINITY_DN12433_c0_g1_i2.p1 TRINITY_DN12433_c0_g1~~TRINITY_DN12433_c0_g1_i2.p1  ORF type:complete len:894 (-),score=128.32 TRINITY_DN12433_c0_g1_i2:185-2866(-)